MVVLNGYEKNRLQPCILNADDELLVQTFYKNLPSGGNFEIQLNRLPSFFEALAVEGTENIVIAVFDTFQKTLTGVGILSNKQVYYNGNAITLGYISSLRIKTDMRKSLVLALLYKQFYTFCETSGLYPSLISVFESNKTARKIFTNYRANGPGFKQLGKYYTLIFNQLPVFKVHSNGTVIRKAQLTDIPLIIDFIQSEKVNYNFLPVYSNQSFNNTNGLLKNLNTSNIYLAIQNNNIVGTLGIWNQTDFRQWIITKYSLRLKYLKPIINVWQILNKKPTFPPENKTINYKTISLFITQNNNPDIAKLLLNKAIAHKRTNIYYALGLFENSEWLTKIKFNNTKLTNILYFVFWKPSEPFVTDANIKNLYIEAGSL